MIRLNQYDWDQDGPTEEIKHLRLNVGLTDYFTMRVTNSSMDERLADGERIERRYAGALDDLAGSQLANPLATNLSIVTADRMVFVSQRSLRVAWNPGGYGPAVSGTGSPLLDCDADGRYYPFRTAPARGVRGSDRPAAARPVVDHLLRPGSNLQGAVPVPVRRAAIADHRVATPVAGAAAELGEPRPDRHAVHDRRGDAMDRAALPRPGRPERRRRQDFFSLLQSLLYEYPDEWLRVIEALTFVKKSASTQPR